MSRRNKLMKLPESTIDGYLGGRPRDPRVTYATLIPKGKTYRNRAAAAEVIKAVVQPEVGGDGAMKPALAE